MWNVEDRSLSRKKYAAWCGEKSDNDENNEIMK